MEKAIKDFCVGKTEADLIQIAIITAEHNLKRTYRKQDSIKQILPLDEKKFQQYTDIINSTLERIVDLKDKLQKQRELEATNDKNKTQ
jgi:uncharacterized membrane protein